MRLVKYVVTEEVQITVPIRREEIRVEQVPSTPWTGRTTSRCVCPDQTGGDGNAPGRGEAPGLPDEIVLHAERPVVTVEVVPVERVRLRVDVVEGQETVTGQVQREQIVVDRGRGAGRQPQVISSFARLATVVASMLSYSAAPVPVPSSASRSSRPSRAPCTGPAPAW